MTSAGPLLNHVRRFLHSLGNQGQGMVVAVSGGPDSMALAQALLELRSGPLVVAHLNHLLRGAESDGDEAFVRDWFASRSGEPRLQLRCERLDVAATARAEGGNLESVARRLRYDWLGRMAQEAGVPWVATGHTADDQAETVLHHLLRGTGLKGLRGMAARRPLAPGIDLVRPLLQSTRAEVLVFLEGKQQSFRQDSSNFDPGFTRSRLRQELLPLLAERFNPAIVSVLGRLAAQADEVHQWLEGEAGKLLRETELPRAGALLVFDRGRLAKGPRHLIREMFRLAWSREGWPQGEMDFAAWERVAGVVLGETRAIDLPERIRVRRLARVVQVGPVS